MPVKKIACQLMTARGAAGNSSAVFIVCITASGGYGTGEIQTPPFPHTSLGKIQA